MAAEVDEQQHRIDSPARTTSSGTSPDARWLALLLGGLFLAVFLIQAGPRISGPFGDNHDGRNGATWAAASRTLREEGPLASRWGARLSATNETYAHHPPLIVTETAAAEAVLGDQPWVTRLPAWLGSLASVTLLVCILRQRRLPLLAAVGGVVVAFASQMFLLYGTMLDTLQTSLPFALGLYLVWSRARPAARSWPVITLAALATLASWEGAPLVAVLAVIDIVRARPRTIRAFLHVPALQGLLVGVLLVAGWLWWATGSLGEIASQAALRTGSDDRTWSIAEWIDVQSVYLGDLMSPIAVVLSVVGLWFAARDLRTRQPLAVFGGVTLAYPVLLPDGAIHHDYWTYWILVPIAVSVAGLFAGLGERKGSPVVWRTTVAVLACGTLALTLTTPSGADDADRAGRFVGERFEDAIRATDGRIRFVAGMVPPARWATALDPRIHEVDDQAHARRLAAPDGDRLVFVRCPTYSSWLDPVCERDAPLPQSLVVPITELAANR